MISANLFRKLSRAMGNDERRRQFSITPIPPYSLPLTGARLGAFSEPVVRFDGAVYRRLLFAGSRPVLMEVQQEGPPARARLKVRLRGRDLSSRNLRPMAETVLTRVLGVGTDVRPFYRKFRGDPLLGPWIRRFRGLRVAGRAEAWDTMIQIVLSQQINLKLAHAILTDIAEAFGRRAVFDGIRYFVFPSPSRFAGLEEKDLRALRLSGAKVRTLLGLAEAFSTGALSTEKLRELGDEEAVELLTSFKGVGPWTAEFTLLRGLSRMDIFPASDLGVIKYLARDMLGREGTAREEDMRDFAERWRPYRGLALIYAYAEIAHRAKRGTQ